MSSGVKTLEGFRYRPELIDVAEEQKLIARVRELPFKHFDFHGYKGKRRVVWFGWRYDYSGRELQRAEEIPDYLLDVRERAAGFAEMDPSELHQVLVTEYEPGAGIGWHRDKAVFGQVVGVSLLSPCMLRFRREIRSDLFPDKRRRREWERVSVHADPRSAYVLTGRARSDWYHSILRVDSLRYSITFRNVLAQS